MEVQFGATASDPKHGPPAGQYQSEFDARRQAYVLGAGLTLQPEIPVLQVAGKQSNAVILNAALQGRN
jgi:hypothetical protein